MPIDPSKESKLQCPICDSEDCIPFNPESLFFPSVSANTILPKHRNNLCHHCGVVFMYPTPSQALLVDYYNSAYRTSGYTIDLGEREIDLPVQFPESVHSFLRFKNMHECLEHVALNVPEAVPTPGDTMIDLGGYQGMFLYAAAQAYGIRGVVADFNEEGIDFARKMFGFDASKVISDPLTYQPDARARFVVMIHALEHMRDPMSILAHIKSSLLTEDGFLFIEVPNAYGSSLSDPTHFFTFSKESLSYLLHKAGFEIVEIRTRGNEHAPLIISSDELVIVCLARVTQAARESQPNPYGSQLGRRITKNYARLTRRGIAKQTKKSFNECLKLGYYLVGHFLLEKLPGDFYSLVSKIKNITGIRIHQ